MPARRTGSGMVAGAALLCVAGCMRPALSYPPSEVCPTTSGVAGADMSPWLIEDAENGDDRILVQDGRNGFSYRFVDQNSVLVGGTNVEGRRPTPLRGGAQDSQCAWNLRGALADAKIAFVGMGFNMRDPKSAYDASAFAGITFFARRAATSSSRVRVHFPDTNTDPDGRRCGDDCFNDFGRDIVLSEQWTSYTLAFAELAQFPEWGNPRPPQLDSSRLYGIQFRVKDHGAPFDVWIDQLAFIAPVTEPATAH
jgi:endoglucanase